MYAVVQIGSRIFRSAWGTKRSVLRLCACTYGARTAVAVAAAAEPARNERRLRLMAASSGAPILAQATVGRQAWPVALRLLFYNDMKAIAAIFRSRADAERAAQRLIDLGCAPARVSVLSPGANPRDAVPTDEGEAPGTGTATGAAIGMPLGAAASLVVPGVGPVIALGLIGAALFSAGGAAIGSALETNLSQGVPRDDLFIYEDALRRGRSVVVALTDDDSVAERAREALTDAGGVDVARARDEWWAGLRGEERGLFTPEEESADRAGFEASLTGDAREPASDVPAAYRRGWERGRLYRGHADTRGLRKSA